jgi:DNA-binding PucR family transcriptional regulator
MVSSDVSAQVAGLAEHLSERHGAIEVEIVDAIVKGIPLLGNDPVIRTELHAHSVWNVRNLLAALRLGDERPDTVLPPETKVMVRTLVRRGIEPEVVYEGYRLAEQVFWQRWMELAAEKIAPNDLAGVLRASHSTISRFIEHVLHQALETMRDEQADIAGGDLSRRIKMVRLLLDGVPLDVDIVSRTLRYDVSRQHTALVLWAGCATAPGALESVALAVARAVSAPHPLVISAGGDLLWTWIATRTAGADIDAAHAAADAVDSGLRVAVGPTAPGIDGFKRSHEGALAVHRVMAADPDGGQVFTYHELEVTALASQDEARARDFVVATLGHLADDTPAGARLRETLRVFLEEAENAPRAAERLHTHRNTVLQRVARATELLGYQPGERRLAVELALELSRRLPALV